MTDSNPSAAQPMTPPEAVADVLAQLDELRAMGASRDALQDALRREGLSDDTAQALADWRGATDYAQDSKPATYGVELSELRRPLRLSLLTGGRREMAGHAHTLAAALQQHGIGEPVAQAVADQLAAQLQAEYDVKLRRLRRLGSQAMGLGALFALFFGAAGLQPEPSARWHLVTAGFCVAMAAYGWAVRRRAVHGQMSMFSGS